MSTVVKVWIPLAFATVAACERGAAIGTTTDGEKVYQSVCATCHGADGVPPAAMAARLGVRDLTSAEFRARATLALIEAQVRNGSANKLMPAFGGAITDDQIKAVAEYVASSDFAKRR
jgi:mono/diheme cytochrome c family protein